MTNSNLIPTPIIDKTGKQTTVYKRLEAVSTPSGSIPGPSVAVERIAGSAAESYGDRLNSIQQNYLRWENGERPSEAERALVAVRAFSVVGSLMWTVTENMSLEDKEDVSSVAESIMSISDSGNYEALIIAERFARVYSMLKEPSDIQWSNGVNCAFDGEDTSDWKDDLTSPRDITDTIDLTFTLRELWLMDRTEIPEHGEPRFFAHLYMAATKTINYRRDDDGNLALIRLVDEFPEHGETIADGIDSGLHAEGIRAVIKEEIIPALAEGAL